MINNIADKKTISITETKKSFIFEIFFNKK